MKKKELAKHTVYLITEYYNNNIQPFLDAFAEDCIWIGPAERQIIRSKKALLDAFAAENNQLTFSMQDLEVIPISVNATSLDVILIFTIISYYPNGETTVFRQRVELLWALEKRTDTDGNSCLEYAVRVCHISNEFPYDANDTIYPNHFTELDIAKLYLGHQESPKAALKGLRGSCYYLPDSSIMWVKSQGSHTFIHTSNHKVYETMEPISVLVSKYADTLCRVHASYAINPAFMESFGRFYVIMDDGTEIPVPEKKYTKVKKELKKYQTVKA